jgi:hypothetical protein
VFDALLQPPAPRRRSLASFLMRAIIPAFAVGFLLYVARVG